MREVAERSQGLATPQFTLRRAMATGSFVRELSQTTPDRFIGVEFVTDAADESLTETGNAAGALTVKRPLALYDTLCSVVVQSNGNQPCRPGMACTNH
ncbi:MAG TPA: hypothetical protein VKB34_19590, partial [Povalibacter sp.]|nr:hypothetical protein [Povalibacter sp.]